MNEREILKYRYALRKQEKCKKQKRLIQPRNSDDFIPKYLTTVAMYEHSTEI